ncbi:hypothetical protein BGZ46_003528 [Entomortierella lignicola]|nr:hypothetical protein BGZ46_003528 [Entomortierella lignicola]
MDENKKRARIEYLKENIHKPAVQIWSGFADKFNLTRYPLKKFARRVFKQEAISSLTDAQKMLGDAREAITGSVSGELKALQPKPTPVLSDSSTSSAEVPPISPRKATPKPPTPQKKRGRATSSAGSKPDITKPRFNEPWHSIVDLAILMYTDWDVELPSLEESHADTINNGDKEVLYNIALENRCLKRDLEPVFKNANQKFGSIKLQEAENLCWLPHLDERHPEVTELIQSLSRKFLEGKKAEDILEHTYVLQHENPSQRLVVSVLQYILKHVIRPLTGKKLASEADALLIWGSIFKDGLPLDCRLNFHFGEHGSAATTLSKSMLAEVFSTGNTTRKCDCLLTVEGLEVGLTATIFKITKYNDIWIVGPASPSIAFPVGEEDIVPFLESSAHVLFNLLL